MEVKAHIDAESVVTARWLSGVMSVNIGVARKALEAVRASDSKAVAAYYMLSGTKSKSGSSAIMIVPESVLERKKKLFSKIMSCDIYSLQRSEQSTDHNVLQIIMTDQNQTEEFLCAGNANSDNFMSNQNGFIKSCKDHIKVKPAGVRAVPSLLNSSSSSGSNKAQDKLNSAGMKSMSSASASSAAVASASAASKKSTTSAKSFFATLNGEESKPEKKKPATKKKGAPGADTIGKAKRAKDKEEGLGKDGVDEDEEWDDGTGLVQPKLKESKKRIVGEDSGDDDEEEEEAVDGKKKKKKAKAAKQDIVVHGGMDNWREDEEEKAKQSAIASGGSPGATKKKYRKKLVEKMVLDEKGYMNVVMVEEEVTDDESNEVASKPKPAASASSQKSKPAPAKKAASGAAAKGGDKAKPAQKSNMMSFFGKK